MKGARGNNEREPCLNNARFYCSMLKLRMFIERAGDIPVKGRGINPAHEHDGPQPYFDNDVARNVTAVASQTAFLRCRVHDLGHKSVSFFVIFFLILSVCIDCLANCSPLRHLLTARVNRRSILR